jgi:hypothetical protein
MLGNRTAHSIARSGPGTDGVSPQQSDFWVGVWDVIVKGSRPASTGSRRSSTAASSRKNWKGAGGGEGKSWNWYDTGDGKWHQLWLDAQGAPSLHLTGAFADGVMRYEGTSIGPGGAKMMNRLQFFKLPENKIRQLWEQSTDGGTTWTTVFDGEYRRRQ